MSAIISGQRPCPQRSPTSGSLVAPPPPLLFSTPPPPSPTPHRANSPGPARPLRPKGPRQRSRAIDPRRLQFTHGGGGGGVGGVAAPPRGGQRSKLSGSSEIECARLFARSRRGQREPSSFRDPGWSIAAWPHPLLYNP